MESYANGALAKLFVGGSGVGHSTKELLDPANAQTVDPREYSKLPNAGAIPDVYARAALAANHIPLAALGLAPGNFTMDAVTDPARVNLAGLYSPKTDQGFVIPGESADFASTLTHEAVHRGLQKLRESGSAPKFRENQVEPKADEENLVRLIMQKLAGDPEEGDLAVKKKSNAYDAFLSRDSVMGKYVDNYIQQMNTAASAEIVRRQQKMGPR